MYYVDFLYIKNFITNINYFFYIKDLFIIFKKIILDFKSICNIFLLISILSFLYFFFLRIKNYEKYKKLKIYKKNPLNVIFFLLIILSLNLKKNLFLLLKYIYIKVGNEYQNIFSISITVLWFLFTIFISIYNSFLLEIIFSDIENIDLCIKLIIIKLLSVSLFFFFLSLGILLVKFDKFILGLIGGALSLSISISLQKMFNNYLAGFIILIDKSFKLGDAVSINGFQGVITQISSRYVMLRNLDCSEALVPNEKFLYEIIQNQSLFFSKGNLRISIQVSHNNNILLVLKILVDSTNNVNRVLDLPPAISYFTNFIINGIELELSFWISDAIRGAALVRSEVNINIWNMLKYNNIELAYSRKILKIIN
ncbi:Mechanosensitive ion channel [Candidatus Nasuia deltocephalinicola]|nr:Mechanosensitive ion channel [Candidatus Nasuia deltocephalinicola]